MFLILALAGTGAVLAGWKHTSLQARPAAGNQHATSVKEETISELERNKRTVVAFFTRAYNDHEPADAVAKYVGSQYIQHNPDTPDGPGAFIESTKQWIAQSPQVSVEIKRVIAEGDLVVTHDLVRRTPDDRGFAGIDIFRLENGKIVEHWDARQPVPEKAANNNTMF
jgi:predicted SnoaL-like aldol condensation-catalyzing enzyme